MKRTFCFWVGDFRSRSSLSLVPSSHGLDAAGGTISDPAWRSKPSWYLVTTDDRMIPPSLQREMSKRAGSTVVETTGSHSIYVSQPAVVADLIERAASEVGSPAMA
jgi:pimeloyl-ACP methyl ester carboxylesterase